MSDHFDGKMFRNLDPRVRAAKGLRDFMRWQRTRRTTPWPHWRDNTATPQPAARLESGELAFTFVNHITFLVQFSGLNVLTDPADAYPRSSNLA